VEEITKICRVCGPKPIVMFSKRKASRDGLSSICKTCESASHKKYYASKRAKSVHRKSKLKLNYGLTIEEFDRMFKEQQGACAICGRTDVALVVDHNHTTGRVRGLLCSGCNHGLGRFKDNIVLLISAMDYLVKYGHSRTTE
jgi:formate dehydrogenase maturation protein FdhE